MKWLQHPSQSNADNLYTVRREASRHFRNKKKEYVKSKIDKLETNSEMKTLQACIGASVILRRGTSLDVM